MKKISLVLLCIMAVFFTSCNNEDKAKEDEAIRKMCEEIHANYPLATLQDIYKTCYQDYFGAEHLMNDTAAARNYINYEFAQCRDTDLGRMPKREPTGFRHRFVRINFSNIVEGELSEEQMLTMFIDAAGKDNAYGGNWLEEWKLIEKIAIETVPEWKDAELQAELMKAAEGNHAVRHSDAFRENYNPHYRIVRND